MVISEKPLQITVFCFYFVFVYSTPNIFGIEIVFFPQQNALERSIPFVIGNHYFTLAPNSFTAWNVTLNQTTSSVGGKRITQNVFCGQNCVYLVDIFYAVTQNNFFSKQIVCGMDLCLTIFRIFETLHVLQCLTDMQ